MHVRFSIVRHVEVHHHANAVHVDAARCDVGGDEDVRGAVAEGRQRARAVALRLVAVNGVGVNAFLLQIRGQLVGAVLGAGEDQRLAGGLHLQDLRQHAALLQFVHRDDHVLDPLGGLRAPADLNGGMAVQGRASQRIDFARNGRREEQRLPLGGEGTQDPLHVGREAHVEHAVGFVEHQHFERRKVDMAALHVVEQPSGRRHDDVRVLAQRLRLRLHADAAVDGRGGDARVAPVGTSALQHLLGQLARRHEHQRAQRALLARGQALENGQHERRGLAGPGLRRADQIAALEHEGDRFLLNGGGALVAFFGDGAKQLGDQPEGIKRHTTPDCAGHTCVWRLLFVGTFGLSLQM